MFIDPTRFRRWAVAALAAVTPALGACATPPSGPGQGPPPGTCPARSRTVIERVADPQASEPQEFSPDGTWLLTSYVTAADELELSLRSVDPPSSPVPVARLVPVHTGEHPSDSQTKHARDLAVTNSGDVTVIGQPVGHDYGVWTWTRATSEVVADPVPQVEPPVGHDVVWLLPTHLSEDAAHTVWLERTTDADGEPANRTVLVERSTGQVVGVSAGRFAHVSNDATLGVRTASSGPPHPVYEVVDLRTGVADEVDGAGEALVASQPSWYDRSWFANPSVSDGGRYVVLWALGSVPGPIVSSPRYHVHVWDRVTTELRTAPIDAAQIPGPVVLAVAADGRTLIERSRFAIPAPQITYQEFTPSTGQMRTVDSEHMAPVWEVPMSRIGPYSHDHRRPSTGDLKNFARTYVPFLSAPTAELRIARCR